MLMTPISTKVTCSKVMKCTEKYSLSCISTKTIHTIFHSTVFVSYSNEIYPNVIISSRLYCTMLCMPELKFLCKYI